MDTSSVRVHRNSSKPAQLSARAYAQGSDIYLGPGQDKHLPHEAWHVVQQAQGRVAATAQMASIGVNSDARLEREADAMGAQALARGSLHEAMPALAPLGTSALSGGGPGQCHGGDPLPLAPALKLACSTFNADSDLAWYHRRPQELRDADDLLTPFAAKVTTDRSERLALLDAAQLLESWLVSVQGQTLEGKEQTRLTKMQATLAQIHSHVGSGASLAQKVQVQSTALEHGAVTPDFADFLRAQHADCIEVGDPPRLTSKGAAQYNALKASFDQSSQKRHVIHPDADQMSEAEQDVEKIVANTYPAYQSALRAPADSVASKRHLIEAASITDSLAEAKPEAVTRERYATTFPGGVATAASLVAGQIYTEPGFLFVGGERPNDSGFHMQIALTKGYPVDARPYYGHSRTADEKKMQWITLPGAQFRYDGQSGALADPYKFTQISR
jgi:hypothetical protein